MFCAPIFESKNNSEGVVFRSSTEKPQYLPTTPYSEKTDAVANAANNTKKKDLMADKVKQVVSTLLHASEVHHGEQEKERKQALGALTATAKIFGVCWCERCAPTDFLDYLGHAGDARLIT